MGKGVRQIKIRNKVFVRDTIISRWGIEMLPLMRKHLFWLSFILLLLLPLSLVLAMAPPPLQNTVAGPQADEDCSDTCDKEPESSVFLAGQEVTYHLTVTNTEAITLSGNITLTDVLPPELTYLSAVGPGWSCFTSPNQTVVNCRFSGPLAPNQSTTVNLDVFVANDAGPEVVNQAEFGITDQNDKVTTYGDKALTPVLKPRIYLPFVVR